ncbi:MAG: ABC transporter ATP-binding protein/permease [Firmicutes bacterium]|nr:ABC transporter ATP-binding protein/permease [Bacillota bacterium]
MLKLKNITKDYILAGGMTVRALKGVSLNFRRSEFVSVLGPSGCGKTTMLNLIGGLDRYTSGDLVIDGRSTKDFADRDWDVYRNHRVGFVFQSYNLIPHQSVLSNVELALTIAGMSKEARVAKAKQALEKVGLRSEMNKRPNQLSGGQSQRVAIARALVNDPEILLADEPTGALDTETSRQILDLVKEIAQDRLVIMVTHNSELAAKYSTRIVRLLDGELLSDTRPFSDEEEAAAEEGRKVAEKCEKAAAEAAQIADETGKQTKKPRRKERAKMSFWTAFKLSFNNLFSKKARTAMTSIAGSIGIIGVSLVLAFSYGIKAFIADMQNDMLSGNPITIGESALNISAMMRSGGGSGNYNQVEWEEGRVNVNATMANLVRRSENMSNIMKENEITQNYIDYLKDYPQEDELTLVFDYGLDLTNNIYTEFTPAAEKPTVDGDGNLSTGDGTPVEISLAGIKEIYTSILGDTEYSQYQSYISGLDDIFKQVSDNENFIMDQFKFVPVKDEHGRDLNKYAEDEGEIMIVVNRHIRDEIPYLTMSDLLLAQLGYYTQNEFMNMVFRATQATQDKSASYVEEMNKFQFDYSDLIGREFTYYPNDVAFKKYTQPQMLNYYNGNWIYLPPTQGADGQSTVFEHRAFSDNFTEAERAEGIPLKVVGILEPKADRNYRSISSGFFYTEALREKIFKTEREKTSDIVKALMNGNLACSTSAIRVTDAFKEQLGAAGAFIPAGTKITTPTGAFFQYDYTFPYDEWNAITVEDGEGNTFALKTDEDNDYRSAQRLNIYTDLERDRYESVLVKDLKKGAVIRIPDGKDENEKQVYAQLTVVDVVKREGVPRTERAFGSVGSPSQYAGIASMLSNFSLPGLSGTGIAAALQGKTLRLRQLSGRNDLGETLPNHIDIYPTDFAAKTRVLAYLDEWNRAETVYVEDENGDFVRDDRGRFEGKLDTIDGETAKFAQYDKNNASHADKTKYKETEVLATINFHAPDGTLIELTDDQRAEIVYSDFLSIIVNMINMFIDIVTIALIGFTSLALFVSCVMIGIITYVSVVERVKEIGVIRSLGGRKRDVSNLFTAETFILGLASGLIGIIFTYIASFIINLIVKPLIGMSIAVFPWHYALLMVTLSIVLTLISGLFPSGAAARKDPVVALRTE